MNKIGHRLKSIHEALGRPTQVNDIDEESSGFISGFQEPEASQIGYIIHLTCGHNGAMHQDEQQLYREHILSSGILNKKD